MKRNLMFGIVLTVGVIAGATGARLLAAQPVPFKATDLLKTDVVGMEGIEVVVTLVEVAPRATIGKHTHPGEEFGYLLEGSLEVQIEGKPAATLKAGDAFFVPAGTVHAAKNVGSGAAKVLATYVVEKGKPLASMIK